MKNHFVPVTTILIGNPGVGKSTILNSLLGKVGEFKSGANLGGGLTKVLQVHTEQDGNKFMDTPGLSDVVMRIDAAKEIEKALKMGGTFKVFFVITLEAGRIKPDDKTTMKLVLDSASQIGTNYSIIINKLQPKLARKLTTESGLELITLLNESLPGTTSIHYNLYNPELDAEDNKITELNTEFLDFIINAPTIQIDGDKVDSIDIHTFERVVGRLAAEIEELKRDNKLLLQKIEEQEARFSDEKRELAKQYKQQEDNWRVKLEEIEQKMKEAKDDHQAQYERDKLERERNFNNEVANQEKQLQQQIDELESKHKAKIEATKQRHKEEEENATERLKDAMLQLQKQKEELELEIVGRKRFCTLL